MSYLKVPSWLELVKLGVALRRSSSYLPCKPSPETLFWKEQALRFGFDIRESCTINTDANWQSFFYAKFFQYTLKRIDNNLQNLKKCERNFWKRNGIYVERLELSSMSQQDMELITNWFPNLKTLVLTKCNALLQASSTILQRLAFLETVEIHDVHLLSEKANSCIPPSIKKLVIHSARGITNEFFEGLASCLEIVAFECVNCPTLQPNQLALLSENLKELDLSGSGSNIIQDGCFHLPRNLVSLKLNGWNHFTDFELALLPKSLRTLEIGGWKVNKFIEMPLEELNLSAITCSDFTSLLASLPKSIKKLNLSKNCISASDLERIGEFSDLQWLDLSGSSPLDSRCILFPETVTNVNLSHSGPLHKETVYHLKTLKLLATLSLGGTSLENSDLEWIPEHVKELDLSHCSQLTDVGLMLLGSLHELETLYLDGCQQIRGFGISSLAHTVKKLSLSGCNRLSGKSLDMLPGRLEELSLEACELVTMQDIHSLPLSLQSLSLASCPNIGNNACDLLSTLPRLCTISLQGCPQITEEAIQKLVRRKFEGTIIINSDIELHPPVSMLKKFTNFKAKLIHKLKTR